MFDVLIDEAFVRLAANKALTPIERKRVLSLYNDFEDGEWRIDEFQSFIWDNIAETSLSARERASLVDQSHTKLRAAAKNLRLTDSVEEKGAGSELAEIVLYGVMKHHYKALPVVPKIFYKQNVNDNAKGADSVHIVVTKDNDFTLWFGEAKFYNSIEDARLPSIVASVGDCLRADKLKKENSIITNVSDLDSLEMNEDLRARIKVALAPRKSIDGLKSKIHVPILLLHECALTKRQTELTQKYKTELTTLHVDRANAYFARQLKSLSSIHLYDQIHFHLIVLPVPSKADLVKGFLAQAKQYRGKAGKGKKNA